MDKYLEMFAWFGHIVHEYGAENEDPYGRIASKSFKVGKITFEITATGKDYYEDESSTDN